MSRIRGAVALATLGIISGHARAEWYVGQIGPSTCVALEDSAPALYRIMMADSIEPIRTLDDFISKYTQHGYRVKSLDETHPGQITYHMVSGYGSFMITLYDNAIACWRVAWDRATPTMPPPVGE